MSAFASYRRMPAASRALAREATGELFALRWLGKDPGYPACMERFGAPRPPPPDGRGPDAAPEQEREARRVGAIVEAVAGRLPWKANCVQRALAAHAMLARRRIPCRALVGVLRDARDPRLDVHAWLMVGSVVVTGAPVRMYRRIAAYGP